MKRRPWLRSIAIGCGAVVAIFFVVAVWIGLQVREMTAPVVIDGVHPFKSAAKKERYLAFYDERAARWPVPSEDLMVDTIARRSKLEVDRLRFVIRLLRQRGGSFLSFDTNFIKNGSRVR